MWVGMECVEGDEVGERERRLWICLRVLGYLSIFLLDCSQGVVPTWERST